ncbi:MAG: hypothetical protein WA885_13920 [Phormidesmis sp.]
MANRWVVNASPIIGATKGKGSFSSVAEVDAYIRKERDSWDT